MNRARIGTVVFHAILLLLVIFIKPDNLEGGNNSSEKEGLVVPLGQANEGSESTAQASTVPEPTKTPDSPSKATENSAETKAVTQNDPKSPVSASDNNEKSIDDANENPNETTEQKNPKDEQEPELTQEEIERQQQKAKNDRLLNTNNKSQNKGEKPGEPGGDPLLPDRDIGGGKPGGIESENYSLNGRTAVNTPIPESNCNAKGVVVVRVNVNANGKVTKAEAVGNIKNGPKSTNLDPCLTKLAVSAAKKTTWTPKAGADLQNGYIVYRFELQ